ncbi:MAG: carbamoyltransferase HypF [Gemmatimonadetes bacterium]|nr:carbamoyltransferase HypF [Gemmatimonadota bacterium]
MITSEAQAKRPPAGRQTDAVSGDVAACEVSVCGVVQGVGFRPYVHRVAHTYGITGWVRNESGRVSIFAEGSQRQVKAFLAALPGAWPPMATIESLVVEPAAPRGYASFEVTKSQATSASGLPVSPDLAMCDECREELLDPGNRRYRFPFITCTNCGPRYTLIEEMPYDRDRTSMAAFVQCAECSAEYHDPDDRRHHSETNSCPACGPSLWMEVDGSVVEGWAAVERAGALLSEGALVAIRGLGGFHIAASAVSEPAVQRLRRRKEREAKPLALMTRDLDHARAWTRIGPDAESLLRDPAHPIVLVPLRSGVSVAPSVAPGLDEVGVMLSYTPLHRLLFEVLDVPLVMTSGNRSDEPIATGNDEARTRLGGIVDGLLLHDREIVSRYDDSVLRPGDEGPVFLRRARGYAPLPLELPVQATEPLLAVGPHLKNTFTLAEGERAFVSPHIGDLDTLESLRHYEETLDRFLGLFGIEPRIVVHDLHPGYLSTRMAQVWAREWSAREILAVQHHHAHVVAVAAEAGLVRPVVGLAFDGLGYGDDGMIWGGEVLVADPWHYRRVARLTYAPMPGGDLAARTPWRAALGYASLDPDGESWVSAALDDSSSSAVGAARWQIDSGTNAPMASSMGRLFDAAAAVAGLRTFSSFEGQAAMELEAAARRGERGGRRVSRPLAFPLRSDSDGTWIMDPLPLLRGMAHERQRGASIPQLAWGFHNAVAGTAVEVAGRVAGTEGLETVALGGGVFQNSLLRSLIRAGLEARGLEVLIPRRLSPNDGGVSYGQAVIAAARLAPGRRET